MRAGSAEAVNFAADPIDKVRSAVSAQSDEAKSLYALIMIRRGR